MARGCATPEAAIDIVGFVSSDGSATARRRHDAHEDAVRATLGVFSQAPETGRRIRDGHSSRSKRNSADPAHVDDYA